MVFHVVDILLFDYFPMGTHLYFAQLFTVNGKHPCNHFLRTDSWNPQEQEKNEATGADWGPLKTGMACHTVVFSEERNVSGHFPNNPKF